MKKPLGKLFAAALSTAAIFAAASGYFLFGSAPASLAGTTVKVTPENAKAVYAQLVESAPAFYPPLFADVSYGLVLLGRNPVSGIYRLEKGESFGRLLLKMRRGQIAVGAFRIPEGAPIWDVASKFLASADFPHDTASLPQDALVQKFASKNYLAGTELHSMEGLFAPDTYFYDAGKSEMRVLEKAFAQQKRILLSEWEGRDAAASSPIKTPYEALILASLIEKESGLKADRSLISSVFMNRLRIGMPLQTDPAVIYGIGPSFNGNLTRADLRRDTPHNTYRRRGLPPTPICAPSRESIHAALHPASTHYLYFVARGDGTTQFSESLSAHNDAVNEYQIKPAKSAKPAKEKP